MKIKSYTGELGNSIGSAENQHSHDLFIAVVYVNCYASQLNKYETW